MNQAQKIADSLSDAQKSDLLKPKRNEGLFNLMLITSCGFRRCVIPHWTELGKEVKAILEKQS